MLKVNEFEHGADNPISMKNMNFQQAFPPKSNFHYRANSAEELLGNLPVLQDMIQDHYSVQCPRLAALDDYTKARNLGIYSMSDRRIEEGSADYRIAHNFGKIINTFDVGYNTGIPIKKISDNDRINEMIREYDERNDIEELDSELWRDMRKYGRAYELQYRNEKDQDKSVLLNVFETFVVYGLDVERTPILAVRYPKYTFNNEDLIVPMVYTNNEIIYYKSCGLSTINLIEDHREMHFWGEVPIIEYSPDRYRQSGFEDVTSLIDAYDAGESDTANYMSDLNDALLLIKGDLNLGQYSVDDIIKMKKARLLLLKHGINPDGSASQTDAAYIYKQYDVNGVEAYKERLRKDIHSISLIPDLTDDAFSGTQSGEAMKYKLFGFQQIAKTSQRGFTKGLLKRYRLLLNIKRFVQEADNEDLGDLKIIFTPNLPKAVLDEMKALIESGAEISQETLLSLASFIDDVRGEMEKVQEEEQRRESSIVDQRMFGDNGETV